MFSENSRAAAFEQLQSIHLYNYPAVFAIASVKATTSSSFRWYGIDLFAPLCNFTDSQINVLGLAWLWKTWQETAPVVPQRRPQSQQTLSLDGFGDFDEPSQASSDSDTDWRAQTNANAGDSLNYPSQGVNLIIKT